jgi:hypothetical protein
MDWHFFRSGFSSSIEHLHRSAIEARRKMGVSTGHGETLMACKVLNCSEINPRLD